ncbi:hypothetical protein CEP52_000003 [Fusarium oligoseptatum]|uniref:Uncharacterized protein n=1 Tax=Fusarium oligoseptatum TaxID=2604345 RepID=A0A428UQ21_9HYPO|nr:hypothetical protein CEP52_000003 [Fusarium oligoseptatum]
MSELQDQVMVGGIESADHDMRNGDTSAEAGASLRPLSPDQASYTPQFTSNASIIMDRMKTSRQETTLEKIKMEVAHDQDATLSVPSASPLLQTLPMSWHHQCYSPTITSEAMAASIFVCAACAADQEQAVRLKGKSNQQRQYEVDKLRQKRLAALPRGVVPAKPGLVGFGPGRAPDSSRTEYFDQMRKTDLLNVLSLCDQLKPNLLVDILVSVSKRHPDLPMFDSPDWEAQLATPFRVHKSSKHEEKARHGHVIISSKARSKHKTTKKILKRTRVIEVITTAPEEDEDILPPTWAKAGEGLYARLAPETEDRSLLMDENDEESFSHFSVDGFGKQIMEPVGA